MIQKIKTIEQPANPTYKDKETLESELILDKNYYTNLKYLHLCFPIGFRKLTNAAKDLDPNLVPVNNFFVHWIKEIDITNYGTNKNLIPTTTPQEVYRYSDAMLKYLQENSYNAECAAKMIKSIELANISDAYSATNTMKFDTLSDTQKHMLWKQYVAWHYDEYITVPISDYINNPFFSGVSARA